MIYRIHSTEELFNKWREIEQEVGVRLFSGIVQNDMFIPTEQLNQEFEQLHEMYLNLIQEKKYTPEYLQKIHDLRLETANYIAKLNELPLTVEEFHEFRQYCPHANTTQQGFANQPSEQVPTNHNCNNESNIFKGHNNCSYQNCPLLKRI